MSLVVKIGDLMSNTRSGDRGCYRLEDEQPMKMSDEECQCMPPSQAGRIPDD